MILRFCHDQFALFIPQVAVVVCGEVARLNIHEMGQEWVHPDVNSWSYQKAHEWQEEVASSERVMILASAAVQVRHGL